MSITFQKFHLSSKSSISFRNVPLSGAPVLAVRLCFCMVVCHSDKNAKKIALAHDSSSNLLYGSLHEKRVNQTLKWSDKIASNAPIICCLDATGTLYTHTIKTEASKHLIFLSQFCSSLYCNDSKFNVLAQNFLVCRCLWGSYWAMCCKCRDNRQSGK